MEHSTCPFKVWLTHFTKMVNTLTLPGGNTDDDRINKKIIYPSLSNQVLLILSVSYLFILLPDLFLLISFYLSLFDIDITWNWIVKHQNVIKCLVMGQEKDNNKCGSFHQRRRKFSTFLSDSKISITTQSARRRNSCAAFRSYSLVRIRINKWKVINSHPFHILLCLNCSRPLERNRIMTDITICNSSQCTVTYLNTSHRIPRNTYHHHHQYNHHHETHLHLILIKSTIKNCILIDYISNSRNKTVVSNTFFNNERQHWRVRTYKSSKKKTQ